MNDATTTRTDERKGGELVILLRHGMAEPSSPHGDRGRALAPGAADTVRSVASRIAVHRPVRALLSPARRTIETFEACREALPGIAEERVEAIYEASADTLLTVLREAGPGTTLLVGHNPGITALAHALSGGGYSRVMDPADAVVVALDREAGTGRLVKIVRADARDR